MNYSGINMSNDFCKSNGPNSIELVVKLTAIYCVGIIGVFINVFIIVLALRFTTWKNIHHLIINIAIADTLVILVDLLYILPELPIYNIYNVVQGPFADFLCKITEFLRHISVLSTFSSLLIISGERYRATRLIVQRRPYSMKERLAIASYSWIIPMALSAYTLSLLKIIKIKDTYTCYWKANYVPYFGLQTVYSAMLFFAIYLLSFLTLRRLSKPQAIESSLTAAQRKARKRRITVAVRMVMTSLLVNSCCYIPVLIIVILRYFLQIFKRRNCLDMHTLYYIVLYFLPILNSSLSPCMFIVFLSDFRDAAKSLVMRRSTRVGPINPRPTGQSSRSGQ